MCSQSPSANAFCASGFFGRLAMAKKKPCGALTLAVATRADEIARLVKELGETSCILRENIGRAYERALLKKDFDAGRALFVLPARVQSNLSQLEGLKHAMTCLREGHWCMFRAELLVFSAAENILLCQYDCDMPAPAAGPVEPVGPSHNADFTMVNWYGTEYTFSPGLQAGAVKALWEEWEKTGLGLHQESVRERIDAERDNFRLSHVFRGHPAYGVMILPCGDGKYRLGKSDAKIQSPKKKARTTKKQVSPVRNGGLSERALRAKRMIDAEYAAAHPED